MKPHVFVDRPIPAEVKSYLLEHCTLDTWEGGDTITRQELTERMAQAQGFLTSGRRVDEELLQAAPKLRAVSTISVGYNHLDTDAMKRHGVIGTHTPEVLDETVADLVFALMLGSARRVAELDRYMREGQWKRGDGANLFGVDVHHATLGIVGMGRIGQSVARRAKFGFEMNVQYYNRSRNVEAEETYGAQYVSLDELMSTSDFVVLLTPLTEGTVGLIGRREIGLMKSSAILINASRGQIVDEEALIDALRNGSIRGAGLDVFQQEPIAPDNPLLSLPSALVLPHIGSATTKTRQDMAMLAAHNLVNVLKGEPTKYIIPEFKG